MPTEKINYDRFSQHDWDNVGKEPEIAVTAHLQLLHRLIVSNEKIAHQLERIERRFKP